MREPLSLASRRWAVTLIAFAAFLIANSLWSAAVLHAQTFPSQAQTPTLTPKTSHKKATSRTKSSAAQPAPQPMPDPPPAPLAPPPPDWPANDRPSDATVTWDSRGLSISAANSSLSQILKQVCTETGATMEGLNKDQRIFGVYGPGPARDVIAQLLDGSGFNVVMIGDLGQATPRHILLTSRTQGTTKQGVNNQQPTESDNDAEPEEQAQQPEPPQEPPSPMPAGAAPGVPVRSREQMVEDMQQRLRQQQQQQLQVPQANPQ